jgi:hypothetical protein
MKELLLIGVAFVVGIAAFIVLLKKIGDGCTP